jgi:hypothetical protein
MEQLITNQSLESFGKYLKRINLRRKRRRRKINKAKKNEMILTK